MHQIKSPIDLFQRQGMGDHRVNLNLAIHIPVYNFRHIGAPSCPAKGRTAPGTAGHQLKRASADLFASPRHTNYNGFPQPLWAHSSATRITSVLPIHSKL